MTKEEMQEELRVHIAVKYGSQRKAAAHWGKHHTFVSNVVAGRVHPSQEMLDDLRLEAVKPEIQYKRKKAAK